MTDESNSTPIYNLKAVVTETGLKPDTLRAWERRYGLPEPHRTQSGHRLYSEHDVKILKWLINRQHEGLSISHAVSHWHRLIEDGKDPLTIAENKQAISQSLHTLPMQVEASTTEASSLSVIDQLRQRWIFACLAFDERQSEQLMEQAFSLFSTELVCLRLLQQGLAEIGMGWLQGAITPQQEHFASSLAMRRLQTLISATPPAIKAERILIGCPPGEMHIFSSTLLTLLLRRRGWNVIYLGANIPIENLVDTVTNMHPKLVVLSAQQLHTAATLLEMTISLVNTNIPVAFGGCIFSQNEYLQKQIPGYYLGNQIDGAVRAIEQILQLPQNEQSTTSEVMHPNNQSDVAAAATFRKLRSQIESDIWKEVEGTPIDRGFLTEANLSIGRTIHSILILRLELEQIHNIDPKWLANTLANHYAAPSHVISHYLFTYSKTLQRTMGQEADAAIQWLNKLGAIQEATSVF